MSEDSDFVFLFARLKAGDASAAAELVRQYECEVRRYVRHRIASSSLRRVFDSMDICQSVLYRFFVDVSNGDVEVRDANQLRALLIWMAKNRLIDRVRYERAEKRDIRRVEGDDAFDRLPATEDSPSEILSNNELLKAIRGIMSGKDLALLERRAEGASWEELALECGVSSDAVRKRVARAIDAAACQIGIIGGPQ